MRTATRMDSVWFPPASTYRIQLSSTFTMHDLAQQIPYLAELGITDIYLSPIFAARPGSTHGYDIVDHGAIDAERGGSDGWDKLCEALARYSLGVVLDIVPNHMAADPVHNRLWRQMLREGPSSAVARYFDVDWRPLTGLIRDKVLLPILEEPYGAALLHGRVALERFGGEIVVRCGVLRLPLAAGSLSTVQEHAVEGAPAGVSDEALAATNADPQRIHAVLEAQHYRLAYWKAANDEINYRRFFDVNELVAIRAEDETVFDESHALALRLASREVVHGLRVDHVDGLLDPTTYLQRLRSAADAAAGRRTWIVVEKVLDRHETLDRAWPVDGTTGYDSLNVLNRLFISGRGVRVLRHFYQHLIDERSSFRDIAYASKRLVMESTLRSGLTILAHALKRVADSSWTTRDITLNALSAALVEFVACLPIYRTYLGNGAERFADRDAVEQAYTSAIRRNPSIDPSALTFLRSLLLDSANGDRALAEARRSVVKRLQQYTSGVHAKGIEDTAYYRDTALLALNEVGGDPGGAAGTLDEFHRFNEARRRTWPDAQTSTSTHDTKLGEDTRIRMASLTAFTNEWASAVRAWSAANQRFRQIVAKEVCPDIKDEYRLYQVLVGVWPAGSHAGEPVNAALVDRLANYMRKAVREAKIHSSWMRPNEPYESAVDAFVQGVLTDPAAAEFRRSVGELVQQLLPLSVCHSISQLVLKCLMPGVPDIYQGDESWALCLTDPDNRLPVDFRLHLETLERQFGGDSSRPVPHATSPRDVLCADLKQYAVTRLLRFRKDHRTMIARAGYAPLRARGPRASASVAFRRTYNREHVIAAVPRLTERSVIDAGWPAGADFWTDTEIRLPSRVRTWTNVLTGCQIVPEQASRTLLAHLTSSWPWVALYGVE